MKVEEDAPAEPDEEAEEDEYMASVTPGSTITAIIPLAVLPHYHPFACTSASLRTQGGPLELRSLVPVTRGDPIFMNIGRGLNNAEVMLRRGRMMPRTRQADVSIPAPNPFDSIRFPFPPQIPISHAKLDLLRRNGLEEDIRARSHLLRATGPLPSKLIDTLRIIFLPDDAVDRVLASDGQPQAKLPLPTDADVQVGRLIEATLRGLMNGLDGATTLDPSDTAAIRRHQAQRIERAGEFRHARRALVAHNQEQLASWIAGHHQ